MAFKIEEEKKAYVYLPFPVGWRNLTGSYFVFLFVKVANLFLAMPVCVALQFVAPACHLSSRENKL